jgi:hypothetical protein
MEKVRVITGLLLKSLTTDRPTTVQSEIRQSTDESMKRESMNRSVPVLYSIYYPFPWFYLNKYSSVTNITMVTHSFFC